MKSTRLPYFPALDGLRGLSVAAVLLFHGGFPWMTGGFLGVSTFFTLSGFLITSLLLAEMAEQGRIDLMAFWRRRLRRLMPAAFVGLMLACIFAWAAGDQVQKLKLPIDVVATLGYVVNWRFILDHQSYANVFGAPSPVLHFWSLAIEEQFYFLYPLAVTALLIAGSIAGRTSAEQPAVAGKGRRDGRLVALVVIPIVAVSIAVSRAAGFDETRIYFGTDTRAPELLVGALLAILLFPSSVAERLVRPGSLRNAVATLGAVALGCAALLCSRSSQADAWLYAGGFVLYALASAGTIAAAILPTGPVAMLLSWAPLRHLGRISYGVYVYHWPLFLWLRQETDLARWPRFVLGTLIALAVAEVSFRFLERPIRHQRRVFNLQPLRMAAAAVGVIVVLAEVAAFSAPPLRFDVAEAWQEMDALTTKEAPERSEIPPGTCIAPPPPRLAFFGDSTAFVTSWGMAIHMRRTGKGSFVHGVPTPGCTLSQSPQYRIMGVVHERGESCHDWLGRWHAAIYRNRPTVTVVQLGPGDIADRRIGRDDAWRAPGDLLFDEVLRVEMLNAVDVLASHGSLVVWLTSPLLGKTQTNRDTTGYDANRRMRHLNAMIKRLPEERPGKVAVVDLARWLSSLGREEDRRLRPDGVHFTKKTSIEAADRWLADAIVKAWWGHWDDAEHARWQAGLLATERTDDAEHGPVGGS